MASTNPHTLSGEEIPRHIPVLDGFRGLAALMVTIFHCWLMTDPQLEGGAFLDFLIGTGLGVDFFFVLSGFVLFLPVVRHGGQMGRLRDYAWRRFARIAPAYYFALFFQSFLTPVLTRFPSPWTATGGLAVLLSHFLFLQHETPGWLMRQIGFRHAFMGFGVNGALWSLSIEVLFYAALPLIAGFYYRRPRLGLLLGVGLALATRLSGHLLPSIGQMMGFRVNLGGSDRLASQFPGYTAHFAFGMTAALVFAYLWQRRRNATLPSVGLAQIASLVVLVLSIITYGSSADGLGETLYTRYLDDIVPAAAFATLMTLTAVASPRGQWLMANSLARWLGDVSYGIFLWHFPLILLFGETLGWAGGQGDASFLKMILLVVPSAALLGALSRHYVELPAIAWARRRQEPRA
jgi:peptidoglycan/LPS O-acetylase OafA/YrhL